MYVKILQHIFAVCLKSMYMFVDVCKDLMERYHGKAEIVDGIIADKEATGQSEKNPDCPSQTVYMCWDSSAIIKDDATVKSTDISQTGEIPADMAAAALSETQWLFRF